MKGSRRIFIFDTARSLSMIWIVCVWHLSASMKTFPNLSNPVCSSITIAALSVFTFMSSFFVSGKVNNRTDIMPFFKKRLARFYPLYVISCASMVLGRYLSGSQSMMTVRQFILSLLGLSTIIGPAPITLWYFSMLILFYVFTPFIDLIRSGKWKLFALILAYMLIAVTIKLGDGDYRVLIFFPCYALGLLLSQEMKEKITFCFSIHNRKFALFFVLNCISLGGAIYFYGKNFDSTYWFLYSIPIAIISITVVLGICSIISIKQIRKIISFLSYISMCAYLFHSQFFLVAELVLGKLTFLQAYLFAVPLLFCLCWIAQDAYDKFRNRLVIKKEIK